MSERRILFSNCITLFLLLVGMMFLTIGVLREEYTIVMGKAINICLECIGIG